MFEGRETNPLIFVIFGIPGGGKTTIAKAVVQKWLTSETGRKVEVLSLDLDDCIPEWMRDNFSVGIYPSLVQRLEFAKSCCNYVDESMCNAPCTNKRQGVIVSFSFMNVDLREQFRRHFPDCCWILIDTAEDEAQRRIDQRADHFYKGKAAVEPENPSNSHASNEWNFDPVTFAHTKVNGHRPIEENASIIFMMMQDVLDQNFQK